MADAALPLPPFVLGAGRDSYPDLRRMKLLELTAALQSREGAITWAMKNGLLAGSRNCQRCNDQMHMEQCNAGDGQRWRCPKQVTFFWSYWDVSQATVGQWLGIGTGHTVPDWYNMHRDLCVDWRRSIPFRIGGPGHIVQIEEILVSSVKRAANGRARQAAERLLFGGVDKATDDAFILEVADRRAAALLPIIQQWVAPGTTIWSNRWAAYQQIPQVTGCQDAAVNHSLNFVEPGPGTNTKGIAILWRSAKEKFRRIHGTSSAHVDSYLDEFLWHRRHGSRDECFNNTVELMRWRYPLPQ